MKKLLFVKHKIKDFFQEYTSWYIKSIDLTEESHLADFANTHKK